MSKAIKIVVIIASSLVGIGILFMGLAFAFGGTDMLVKNNPDINVKMVSATFDEVDIVNVKDVSNDVKITKSEKNQVKVTYAVSDKFSYYVKQIDNTLQVEYDDFRHWYDFITIFGSFREPDLTIELPEKTLKELNVKTSSGSIEANSVNAEVTTLKTTSGRVEVGGNVGDLTANATSGSVKVNADTQAEMAVVGTTSGKVQVSGNIKGDVIADNTSGGIILENLKCKNVYAKASSGRIDADNLAVKSIKAEVSSGRVTFDNVICTGDMDVKTTSGSINLDGVDAENYDLNTTSGGIKAEILTAKLYNVKSNSGSVRTPEFDSNANGVLNAKATSGSVTIELAD